MAVKGPTQQNVRILSPGKSAYEVKLIDPQRRYAQDLLFMGERDSHERELSQGDIVAVVSEVGAPLHDQYSFTFNIAKGEDELDLGKLIQDLRSELQYRLPLEQEKVAGPSFKGASDNRQVRSFSLGLSQTDYSKPNRPVTAVAEDVEVSFTSTRAGVRIEIDDEHGPIAPIRAALLMAVEDEPPLHAPLPLFRGGISIELIAKLPNESWDGRVRITPCDPDLRALFNSLGELSDSDAVRVVEMAAEANPEYSVAVLAEKRQDYWAATVAALALARTEVPPKIVDWMGNLVNWAPHIPDAKVALAWCISASDDGDSEAAQAKTADLLRQAVADGPQVFYQANQMARDLLGALALGDPTSPRSRQAQMDLDRMAQENRTRVRGMVSSVWFDSEALPVKVTLPAGRFRTVESGQLIDDEFVLRQYTQATP